jgi:hypothetical protein
MPVKLRPTNATFMMKYSNKFFNVWFKTNVSIMKSCHF